MQISQELQKSYDVYARTHENKSVFKGFSIVQHFPEIVGIVHNSNIRSYLDYGCGKGLFYKECDLRRMLADLRKVSLYDPGVPQYATIPTEKHDMVVCIDVMEHVPEECVDEVLNHIASLTNKIAFFSISTRPASKTIADGSNAHATVRPRDWWMAKLATFPHLVKCHFMA